jgi:hypothetical protein
MLTLIHTLCSSLQDVVLLSLLCLHRLSPATVSQLTKLAIAVSAGSQQHLNYGNQIHRYNISNIALTFLAYWNFLSLGISPRRPTKNRGIGNYNSLNTCLPARSWCTDIYVYLNGSTHLHCALFFIESWWRWQPAERNMVRHFIAHILGTYTVVCLRDKELEGSRINLH